MGGNFAWSGRCSPDLRPGQLPSKAIFSRSQDCHAVRTPTTKGWVSIPLTCTESECSRTMLVTAVYPVDPTPRYPYSAPSHDSSHFTPKDGKWKKKIWRGDARLFPRWVFPDSLLVKQSSAFVSAALQVPENSFEGRRGGAESTNQSFPFPSITGTGILPMKTLTVRYL